MMHEDILLTIHKTQIHEHQAHFELKPMDAGYATALGNALRRVLLASLPGAAITAVTVVGVQHEFQDIPDVLEDMTDIVFHLKQVRLRCYADHAVKLHLDVRGPCAITAGALVGPETVEIVNRNLHIATLDNEQAHLVMELTVGRGRGFVSADVQAALTTEALPIGVILVDAIFSPVVKVHFSIEPLYQGRRDQTACIHLEITTDGTLSPAEALRESAAILVRQLSAFATYQRDDAEEWKRPTASDVPIPRHIYERALEDLPLSARAQNCLRRSGITTVGPILEMNKTDLLGIRNLGEKIVQELEACVWEQHFLPESETIERAST